MRLDELDHAIIGVLKEDATIPLRTLVARCQSSEATVRRRIARLRRNDVIRITAVVDPFKQGYPVVAIINMKIDQRQRTDVKKALGEMRELRFVGMTVGAFDIVAEAWFQSTEKMFGFISEILTSVPGILRAEPLQILEMITYAYDWGKQRDPAEIAGRTASTSSQTPSTTTVRTPSERL
jgi:Lrp/AsnC family transcriptional regulator, regulator for asnA, asnC and gidA